MVEKINALGKVSRPQRTVIGKGKEECGVIVQILWWRPLSAAEVLAKRYAQDDALADGIEIWR